MPATLYSPSQLQKWVFITMPHSRSVKCTLYSRDDTHRDEWGRVVTKTANRVQADKVFNEKLAQGWTTC